MSSRTRFLMVYPEIPDTYWSYHYALGIIGRRALMPPLGLATVAAMVPREYDCSIVDMNIEPLTDAAVAGADLVLISAMIVQRDSARSVIDRCKRLGVPVAVGGPYATSAPEQFEDVDYLILDEGEITFPQFLADYAGGAPRPVYRSERKPNLASTPIPRFELLKLEHYYTVPVQFSRGCPFDCEFCDIVQLFGRKVRTKHPEQFLAEMDTVFHTGFQGGVFIVDDNFIGNHRRTKELLHAIISWQREHGYPFTLSTEASIDLAYDPELLELMAQANFGMVFVGLETPIDDSLAAAGKQQNRKRDVLESVRTIQRAGIEVTGGFIIGFDSDPSDIFDRQIEFIEELAVPTAMVGLLTALPQTKLYDRLAREGRLYGDSSGNNYSSAAMNFQPLLPEAEIDDGYRRVLKTIYSPARYFERCLRLLEIMPKPRREHGLSATKADFLAAFRSVFRQTFSRYGHHYLAFMVRALLRRPDQFVRSFTLAIKGHHYLTVTRRSVRSPRPESSTSPRAPNYHYERRVIAGTMK